MLLLRVYFSSYLQEKQNYSIPKSSVSRKISSARLPVAMQLVNAENLLLETEDDPLLVSLGDKDLTLDVVQTRLNYCKLTKLIVTIVKRSNVTHSVMLHSVNLAVAILNGGNQQVQVMAREMALWP